MKCTLHIVVKFEIEKDISSGEYTERFVRQWLRSAITDSLRSAKGGIGTLIKPDSIRIEFK